MRTGFLIIAALFGVFAIVQLNDVDPTLWVIMYGSVAIIAAVAAFRPVPAFVPLLGLLLATVWLVSLLPEFINWVQMGMPSITSKMKAEEPHIEYTREFLGLGLCIAAFGYLFQRSRKLVAA